MFAKNKISMFPITSFFNQCLLRVEDSIFMRSTGSQSESGDSRASNVGGGSLASQRSGTKISMSTSSASNSDLGTWAMLERWVMVKRMEFASSDQRSKRSECRRSSRRRQTRGRTGERGRRRFDQTHQNV